MALVPTLSIKDTTTFSDEVNFSVTDSLTVTAPSSSLSTIIATATGGNHIIVPSSTNISYLFVRHTGTTDGSTSTSQLLNVETADNTVVCTLGAGEFMFAPVHDGDATLIQLEAASGTIVAEYAYWTKG